MFQQENFQEHSLIKDQQMQWTWSPVYEKHVIQQAAVVNEIWSEVENTEWMDGMNSFDVRSHELSFSNACFALQREFVLAKLRNKVVVKRFFNGTQGPNQSQLISQIPLAMPVFLIQYRLACETTEYTTSNAHQISWDDTTDKSQVKRDCQALVDVVKVASHKLKYKSFKKPIAKKSLKSKVIAFSIKTGRERATVVVKKLKKKASSLFERVKKVDDISGSAVDSDWSTETLTV